MTQAQTNVNGIAVQTDSEAFSRGFIAGLTNVFGPNDIPHFDLSSTPTEAGIVDVVLNACELQEEGRLTEEVLRFTCGLVAGWVSRQAYSQDQTNAPAPES